MAFQAQVNEELYIEGVEYLISAHPHAPGMPYGQEGRAATVYQVVTADSAKKRALKVFKARYQVPAMVGLAQRLRAFADMPGLQVCVRSVHTARRHIELVRAHPDLAYSVLMPWIEGPTWMEVLLDQREISPEESLLLSRALLDILAGMEERGIAHCDLSGPNMILPYFSHTFSEQSASDSEPTQDESRLPIELIDVEQLFGPGLDRPQVLTGGSYGYAHPGAAGGLWQPEADRFAGALIISEMLGWCDPRVREASWGESYFDPEEMQQDNERYRLLTQVLRERWGEDPARLLEQAWNSDSLDYCPTFGRWLVALPETVPVPKYSSSSTPAQAEQVFATGSVSAGSSSPGARPKPPENLIASTTVPTTGATPGKAQGETQAASNGQATKVTVADDKVLASLFDDALAAYQRKNLAAAVELLTEVVRISPQYARAGEQAASLLAAAGSRLSQAVPDPSAQVADSALPEVTSPAKVGSSTRVPGGRWRASASTLIPIALVLILITFSVIAIAFLQGQSKSGASPSLAIATATSVSTLDVARSTPLASASAITQAGAGSTETAEAQVTGEAQATTYAIASITAESLATNEAAIQVKSTEQAVSQQTANAATTAQAEQTVQTLAGAGATAQVRATIEAAIKEASVATAQANSEATVQVLHGELAQAHAQQTTYALQATAQANAQAQQATAEAQQAAIPPTQVDTQGTAQARQVATSEAQAARATISAERTATALAAAAQAEQKAQALRETKTALAAQAQAAQVAQTKTALANATAEALKALAQANATSTAYALQTNIARSNATAAANNTQVAQTGATASAIAAQNSVCGPLLSESGVATPNSVKAGGNLIFQLTGFDPGEGFTYRWVQPDGSIYQQATTAPYTFNERGELQFDYTIPRSFGTGRWTFEAAGIASDHPATIYVCVTQ